MSYFVELFDHLGNKNAFSYLIAFWTVAFFLVKYTNENAQ